MGKLIRFPVERRQKQIAAQVQPVTYIRRKGWFGVRLRPNDYRPPAA